MDDNKAQNIPNKETKINLFKSKGSFSVKKLLVFGFVFMAIGGLIIIISKAATPPVATMQAEQMSLPSGASVINDSTASGGKAIKFTQNGTSATGQVTVPSQATSISISARGTKCKNTWPAMVVTVDNYEVIPSTFVTTNSWKAFSSNSSLNMQTGSHTVKIFFYTYGCSTLLVDVAYLYGPTTTATPPTVALTASPTTVSAGSSSNLSWNSTNASSCTASGAWTGTQATSGTLTTGALNASSTYSLSCTGTGGTATANATVTVSTARRVPLGAAINNNTLSSDPTYKQTFLNNFDSLTPENEMKWDAIEPTQNNFTFTAGDQLVSFAQANGKYVRGHTLVWYSQLPTWVSSGTWTKDTLTAALKNHIQTTAKHYAGKVGEWDVVNEAINEDGTLRQSVFYNVIGPDYIKLAFQWAHEADPNAKLYLNDYNVEWTNTKSTAMYNLVQSLKSQGIPIDGVGFQAHWAMTWGMPMADVVTNMQRFASLGLQIEVTEADVSSSSSQWVGQADIYNQIASGCYQVTACNRFTTWGVSDKYTWIGTSATPLLFDTNFAPKPAFTTVKQALGR